jgi:cytochrome P450
LFFVVSGSQAIATQERDVFAALTKNFLHKQIDIPVELLKDPGADIAARTLDEKHVNDLINSIENAAVRTYVLMAVVFLDALTAEKRQRPDDSLLSGLVAVEDEGETLTEAEIVSTAMVLLEAGHEATVNSLANGMRAMMLHRDQWQRVTSGEVSPRTAIEDMIRWDAPLHLFERWVLDEGVVIAGQPMPVGAEVAMLFGAANRDPRRFDDPGRFDVGRGDPAHVGFGGGIHFCIGAPLARLELEVSLDRLARRLPDVELAAEPEYHPTFVIRGLTALHLTT